MPEILIYATKTCPFCTMAKRLLDAKGVRYEEKIVSSPAMWNEVERVSGRNTVPQIFIGETHVGGFDDLSAADQSGKLDELLAN